MTMDGEYINVCKFDMKLLCSSWTGNVHKVAAKRAE